MTTISMVIVNCGDGSNAVEWVRDKRVLTRMEELVDEGDEAYGSGEGLQVRELRFPKGFDLDAWVKLNNLYVRTLENLE